uniref:(northern house mosquito) hypothetical protein n=1 Tax=Culex pipiens TaxID=7175 RepID=A0A8D8B3H1_CULPI
MARVLPPVPANLRQRRTSDRRPSRRDRPRPGLPRPQAGRQREALLLQLHQGLPLSAQIRGTILAALPRQDQRSQPPQNRIPSHRATPRVLPALQPQVLPADRHKLRVALRVAGDPVGQPVAAVNSRE